MRIGGEKAMKILNAKLDKIEEEDLLNLCEPVMEYPYDIKKAGEVARRLNAIPVDFGEERIKNDED